MTRNASKTGHEWPCVGFYLTSTVTDRTERCTCRPRTTNAELGALVPGREAASLPVGAVLVDEACGTVLVVEAGAGGVGRGTVVHGGPLDEAMALRVVHVPGGRWPRSEEEVRAEVMGEVKEQLAGLARYVMDADIVEGLDVLDVLAGGRWATLPAVVPPSVPGR